MRKQSDATAAHRNYFFYLVDGTNVAKGTSFTPTTIKVTKGDGSVATGGGTWNAVGSSAPGQFYYQATQAEQNTPGTIIVAVIDSTINFGYAQTDDEVVGFDPNDATALGLTNIDTTVSSRASQSSLDSDNTALAASILTRSAPGDQMNLASGAITSAKIASGAIAAAAFAANAITSTVIATDAIGSAQIAAGAITAVEAPNLDAAVSSRAAAGAAMALSAGAITTSAFADGAITAAKFAANAITSTVIADNALTATKFAAGAFAAVASVVTGAVVYGSRTIKGILKRMDRVNIGKATGLNSSTATFLDEDNSTPVIQATQDTGAGTRQAASTASGD